MKNNVLLTLILLSFSIQAKIYPELKVHEWGTFTARYDDLGNHYDNLHSFIHEPVPAFVHHIDFDQEFSWRVWNKDSYYLTSGKVNLEQIKIKMETPVLYFYSNSAVENVNVNVKFKQGSISEYYPNPLQKESKAYIENHLNFNRLNFLGYTGHASWTVNVLPPNTSKTCTQADNDVPPIWLRPRETNSNLIESGGDIEKYIFYRGLGSFTNPVQPFYTKSGHLKIANNTDDIPFAIAYEYTESGERYIWGMKSINAGDTVSFMKSTYNISNDQWESDIRPVFVNELVKAGLYRDEAEAMLNTWDESYFQTSGLIVFWVVPRSFTDEILPIEMNPQPTQLERVMVGRTEIDNYDLDHKNSYLPDPIADQTAKERHTISIKFYPNPSSGKIFIEPDISNFELRTVEIYDSYGNLVITEQVILSPYSESELDVSSLVSGSYFLKVEGDAKMHRFLKL
jgi:hypothetical protein